MRCWIQMTLSRILKWRQRQRRKSFELNCLRLRLRLRCARLCAMSTPRAWRLLLSFLGVGFWEERKQEQESRKSAQDEVSSGDEEHSPILELEMHGIGKSWCND
jgi:hypothetical protein